MHEEHDLCFGKLLPAGQVEAAFQQHQVRFRDRLYTPLLTLWTFLCQVLSADHSCRAAVAHLLAFLGAGGDDSARQSGAELQRQVPSAGLLGGRRITIVDGTTLSMPDTPANQKAYPQHRSQKKGLGFPILRLVGLICLSCGAVLDVAMYAQDATLPFYDGANPDAVVSVARHGTRSASV